MNDYELELVETKRPGRPTILEEKSLTLEQLAAVYANSNSEREAAAKLGITARTLRKYLRMSGVDTATPRSKAPGVTHNPSPVYYWIRDQHGIIPRSTRAIAQQSGLSHAMIAKFLERRRKAAMVYLNNLGSIRELPGHRLTTTRGQLFSTEQIAQAQLSVDLYSLAVTLKLMLRSGVSVVAVLSFNTYRELFPSAPDEPRELSTIFSDPRATSPLKS